MNPSLTILVSVFAVFVIILTIALVVKRYIKVKYALVWIVLFAILLVAVLVPGFLEWVTYALGFQVASNLVICLFIGVLVIISITTTAIISKQNASIRMLIQENSILHKEIDDIKDKMPRKETSDTKDKVEEK